MAKAPPVDVIDKLRVLRGVKAAIGMGLLVPRPLVQQAQMEAQDAINTLTSPEALKDL